MQNDLLDDYIATDDERPPIRTAKLERIENILFIGYGASIGLYFASGIIFNGVGYLSSLLGFSMGFFIRIGLLCGGTWWWRRCSIRYDNDKSIKDFRLPLLLQLLRILTDLYILLGIIGTLNMIVNLPNYSLEAFYLLEQAFSIFLVIFTGYHLYYTSNLYRSHQSLVNHE